MLRIIITPLWQKTEAKYSSNQRCGILRFMTQDPDFLGVHLLPHGVSGNRKAVSPARVLTTP